MEINLETVTTTTTTLFLPNELTYEQVHEIITRLSETVVEKNGVIVIKKRGDL